jgi:radical SAM superfamily enzyme YgiQ (UPF0313 family)
MLRNILLINPWIYDFAAYDFWIAPLGLLYIGSFLRENGFHVQLINCLSPEPSSPLSFSKTLKRSHQGHGKYPRERVERPDILKKISKRYSRYGISHMTFLERLKACVNPDLVLITSMMTYWYPAVFDAIKAVRARFPGTPIVLGGNYATLCQNHSSTSGADFIITGEGETPLTLLIRNLFNQEVSFAPDPEDLDSYPYPAYDLLWPRPQVSLITSRGCPYRCTYCASPVLNRAFRQRDPLKVVNEIEHWHKNFGIDQFSFYDDALLVHPQEMFIPFLKELIRRGMPCRFHCPNGLHLREITPEVSHLMHQAGFTTVRFGFETANPSKQSETGGKVRNEHLQDAVAYLKEAGYPGRDIGIYLLCGLPGQTAHEVRESIHFVKFCGAKPILAEYSPIPGTALWDAAIKASPYPIVEEPLFHNNSLLPCQNEAFTLEMYQELKKLSRSA